MKTDSARNTPALASPGPGPVRGGSVVSASSSARGAAEPYPRPAVYAPDPQLVNIRYDRQILCGSCIQMGDRSRFSNSQLKKAANKFDTARREGSFKLIKPNDWPKCEHCVPKPRQTIRCVACRLEKDRKEFSDAMRAKDRAAICKKCQAAALDKEDTKRREEYVSSSRLVCCASAKLTFFTYSIDADPWASVDPGGGDSSDTDSEADLVPPAHFDAAAAYRVHDAGSQNGGAGGIERGTQLAPVWDDDEDEW
ncbi:hypothetical protein JCM10295v2_000590 [Rhodotorula toruloides]